MEDTGPDTPEPARKRSKKAKPRAAAATPGGLAALRDFVSARHSFVGLMVCMSYHILFAEVPASGLAVGRHYFDRNSLSAGSADPALQLGVFADRSESDEELLAALAAEIPNTKKPVRSRARRSRAKQASSGTKHALLRPQLLCAVRPMSVHCARVMLRACHIQEPIHPVILGVTIYRWHSREEGKGQRAEGAGEQYRKHGCESNRGSNEPST